MNLAGDAIKSAAETMRGALSQVTGSVGKEKKQKKFLTPVEQLDRFSKLGEQDFKVLSERYGPQSVEQYVDAMRDLAGRYK